MQEKGTKADETAILELLRRLGDAWNRGDGRAFGAVFDEDADYVVFNGAHLKGRKQIADTHQWLFDNVLKGTRLGGNEQNGNGSKPNLRFLTADVALLHSTGGVLRKPDEKTVSEEQNSTQTYVFVKRNGAWSIAAFQNTRIQPMPPGGPPPKP